MRKLIVTRGVQGAGKSYTLRQLGLDGYMLSGDVIRQMLGSPTLLEHGDITTYHDQEPRVWGMLYGLLEERMARGELIAIDATHRRRRDFKRYLQLAERYHYDIACLDFSAVPLELALERNRQRAPWAVVPEDVMERTWKAVVENDVPEEVHRVLWSPEGEHIEAMQAWLQVPVLDASPWKAVHHIGDLQGCFTPLKQWLDAHGGVRDDALYIFVGDLCDRGIENAEVVQFMLEHHHRDNVIVLWGNHEDHLDAWAHGEEVRSEEFNLRTAPQLEQAGIEREAVKALCRSMQACVLYQWGEHRVIVTHAGLSTLPEMPAQVSVRQYGRGTGRYNSPVDRLFTAQAPEGWVQVHGHRNPWSLPIRAADRSFNLEGAVEHGGHLRCLTLDERGFTGTLIANRIFAPLEVRMTQGSVINHKKSLPPWVKAGASPLVKFDEAGVKALQGHALIAEKPSPSLPHISAFNFTRDAFMDRLWDDLNITARGLFVDTTTGEIVARSYDKFFNLGERPETQPGALAESLRFPVDVYVKENGYLGILGYDAQSDSLLCATKSTLEGDFAVRFKGLLDDIVGEAKLEGIRRYLRDTGSSMTFEVVDPKEDPHIIEYDGPRVILLDVVRRSPAFEGAPYAVVQAVGRRFELEVKQKATRFSDWPSLWGWLQSAQQADYTFQGSHIEGFVLEDAVGFQTKVKLGYYLLWKRLRGLKDRVLRVRGTDKPLNRDVSDAYVHEFYQWCLGQSDEVLSQDIMTLRRAYLSGAPATLGDTPAAPRAPMPPSREVVGFTRALDGLASSDASIKAATADALIAKALADDRLMAVLKDHTLRVPLLMAASLGPERQAAGEAVGLDLDDV
ncbi:MAG: RNA ligase [Bradymonadia bacterium]